MECKTQMVAGIADRESGKIMTEKEEMWRKDEGIVVRKKNDSSVGVEWQVDCKFAICNDCTTVTHGGCVPFSFFPVFFFFIFFTRFLFRQESPVMGPLASIELDLLAQYFFYFFLFLASLSSLHAKVNYVALVNFS